MPSTPNNAGGLPMPSPPQSSQEGAKPAPARRMPWEIGLPTSGLPMPSTPQASSPPALQMTGGLPMPSPPQSSRKQVCPSPQIKTEPKRPNPRRARALPTTPTPQAPGPSAFHMAGGLPMPSPRQPIQQQVPPSPTIKTEPRGAMPWEIGLPTAPPMPFPTQASGSPTFHMAGDLPMPSSPPSFQQQVSPSPKQEAKPEAPMPHSVAGGLPMPTLPMPSTPQASGSGYQIMGGLPFPAPVTPSPSQKSASPPSKRAVKTPTPRQTKKPSPVPAGQTSGSGFQMIGLPFPAPITPSPSQEPASPSPETAAKTPTPRQRKRAPAARTGNASGGAEAVDATVENPQEAPKRQGRKRKADGEEGAASKKPRAVKEKKPRVVKEKKPRVVKEKKPSPFTEEELERRRSRKAARTLWRTGASDKAKNDAVAIFCGNVGRSYEWMKTVSFLFFSDATSLFARNLKIADNQK